MEKLFTILWDMDKTLGNFDALAYPYRAKKWRQEDFATIKDHLAHSLRTLSAIGARHVLTSSAHEEHVNNSLKAFDLHHNFEWVFDKRHTWNVAEGEKNLEKRRKSYLEILSKIGIAKNDAPKNTIVIGDNIIDRPLDVDGMVHIRGQVKDALIYRHIIRKLRKLGDGDFAKGFDKLLSSAESENGKPYWKFKLPGEGHGAIYKFVENGILHREIGINYNKETKVHEPEHLE